MTNFIEPKRLQWDPQPGRRADIPVRSNVHTLKRVSRVGKGVVHSTLLRAGKPARRRLERSLVLLLISLALVCGCNRKTEAVKSCCDEETSSASVAEADSSAVEANPAAIQRELFVNRWSRPEDRLELKFSHTVTRHDGAQVNFSDLVGKPMAISFAYTHCENPNKCKRATTCMAGLRRAAEEAGLLDRVNLVMITYDPLYDTPKVLEDYSKRLGLRLDDHVMFFRPPVDPEYRLFRDLQVAASFSASGVAIHGIQLLLIDKAGRLAANYHTLIWNNEEVVQDLMKLAEE
jgi:protein SCO1/2